MVKMASGTRSYGEIMNRPQINKVRLLLEEAIQHAIGYSSLSLSIKKIIDTIPLYVEEYNKTKPVRGEKRLVLEARRAARPYATIAVTYDREGHMEYKPKYFLSLEEALEEYEQSDIKNKKIDEESFKALGKFESLKRVRRREQEEFKLWQKQHGSSS